jgi:hypothetical protein
VPSVARAEPAPDALADEPRPTEGAPADGPLPEFDPRVREPFVGLVYLGALEDTFTWVGHEFHIRTLRSDELVEVARCVARYSGTDGYLKAYQGAVTAACVLTADGQRLPGVPLAKGDGVLEENFRYVMGNWFPPVLDKVYEQYILLEITAREVIEAMEKASG